jgi:hypothetical protein
MAHLTGRAMMTPMRIPSWNVNGLRAIDNHPGARGGAAQRLAPALDLAGSTTPP